MLEIIGLQQVGLKPVSFTLNPGECIAVCGPSGAGKTLLLRAIADLDPNLGRVRFHGRERESILAPAWRRQVLFVPAQSGWWADTVGAHFGDWLRAVALLRRLHLPDDAVSWRVARCSSGELARLALVRALTCDPKVLLLDEPTAALDADMVQAVESILHDRIVAGMSALWVTHDSAQAARIAHRLLTVRAGVVQEQLPS